MRRGPGAGIEKETQGAAKPTLESRCFRQARRPCRQYVDLPRRRRHLLPQSLFTIRYFRELVNPGGGKKFSAPGGTAAPTPAPADRLRSWAAGRKTEHFSNHRREPVNRETVPPPRKRLRLGRENSVSLQRDQNFWSTTFIFVGNVKNRKRCAQKGKISLKTSAAVLKY